jgi:hypothetical protein
MDKMMAKTKLSDDVRAYFAKEGAKGGKIGGKKRMEAMTPEQRSELARKAVAARGKKAAEKSAEVRSKKATAKRKPANRTKKPEE